MGYTTEFSGEVTINPPLNQDEIDFLTDFNRSRRMIRRKGPLFVGGSGDFGQGNDEDIIDHNRANGEPGSPYGNPPADYAQYQEENGQPGLWCQWVPTDDGEALEWDGGEKFYNAPRWMKYIVENLLSEKARAYIDKHIDEDPRLKSFTCNHVVNGEILAQGEDSDDVWKLIARDNVVMVAPSETVWRDAEPI